jgi:hypothetical protein
VDLSRRLRLKSHPKMAARERLIGHYIHPKLITVQSIKLHPLSADIKDPNLGLLSWKLASTTSWVSENVFTLQT